MQALKANAPDDNLYLHIEQRGYERGLREATSIHLSESGYGSGQHAVCVITAKSRRELSRKVKQGNYRRDGDNPGQAYMWSRKLLRAYRGDDGVWEGVCISSTYYDI